MLIFTFYSGIVLAAYIVECISSKDYVTCNLNKVTVARCGFQYERQISVFVRNKDLGNSRFRKANKKVCSFTKKKKDLTVRVTQRQGHTKETRFIPCCLPFYSEEKRHLKAICY